jgi:hypothetical protein
MRGQTARDNRQNPRKTRDRTRSCLVVLVCVQHVHMDVVALWTADQHCISCEEELSFLKFTNRETFNYESIGSEHRLNMESDVQSLFGLHLYSTAVLID